MRVKPPGAADDGPPPIEEVGEAEPAAATTATGAVDRAQATTAAMRTGGSAPADAVTEIARRIKAGELSAGEAVELLIDEVVRQGPGAALGDRQALADELKDLLRRQLETDPYLASRVRRLGLGNRS